MHCCTIGKWGVCVYRDGFVNLAQVGGEYGGVHKEFIRREAAPPT
jgi:hypothetical protein